MAAEIDMSNGRANIAFAGSRNAIWHGLGQELSGDADLDVWTREAGMNWDIEYSPVIFESGQPDLGVFDGKVVLYRSDNRNPLSIVSSKYKVVQPKEVMEFFRDLTEDLGMEMSTAGCLFDGRKFWALADTGEAGVVLKKDLVKGYLLLTSSCDGTSPTVAMFTSIRVVCNNTLTWSLQGTSGNRAAVRHRKTFSPTDVKRQLGLVHGSWNEFMESVGVLSKVKMTEKDSMKFIKDLIVKPYKEPTEAEVRKIDKIYDIGINGMGSDITRGTLWGVVNGVTEFVDHHSGGRSGDTKLWNSWYGDGADLKTLAFEKAKILVAG